MIEEVDEQAVGIHCPYCHRIFSNWEMYELHRRDCERRKKMLGL